jgi:DNA-binding transcriptional MerR regulator
MSKPCVKLVHKEPINERIFHSITEVSDMLGVKPHVLRYWEQEFGAVRPKRTPRGVRRYRKEDIETLKRIKELVWTEGYTVEGAKRRLDQERKGEAKPRNPAEILRLIDEVEQRLWSAFDILNSKIEPD